MGVKLDRIFDSYMKSGLFKNKFSLQTNYTPENIPHRDKQIEQIASILAPVLKLERVSNLFIYGETGTGKTLSVLYVKNELISRSKKLNIELNIEYVNCKLKTTADTEYRILTELIKRFGGDVPLTGLSSDILYNKFIELLEKKKQLFILILDEIDQTAKKTSGDFLYRLTRLNSELINSQIALIGISNNLTFLDNIDARAKSSLGEEELVFPPYNALQLKDILENRAKEAFKENVIDEGVIEKCAALAAIEHGDARRALDLLRIAGELAEREGKAKVEVSDIDKANDKMERDKILDVIEAAPKQFKLVLLSIMNLTDYNLNKEEKQAIFTGDIYQKYKELCLLFKIDHLTQRRVGDIIADFDMLGIINAITISKGRHGRMREIKLLIPKHLLNNIKNIINQSFGIE
jgi:cell division control protein 6